MPKKKKQLFKAASGMEEILGKRQSGNLGQLDVIDEGENDD